MELKDASRVVLMEAGPCADLRNVAQAVYDDFSACHRYTVPPARRR
jgi:hypothetical protein